MAEDDSGRSSGTGDYDEFLRGVAEAPAAPPRRAEERDPVRVAHFRISGRLGSGGMGVVYRAYDESLHRDVALKLLPGEHATDPTRRQRFLREARAAAALVHPNVAMVHQVGEADGRVFIAMELVEGVTLREHLEAGALPTATTRELAMQMAQGLAAAHGKGIVHRDLKPENVMVLPGGGVKLLDFGLAKNVWSRESEVDLGSADTEAQITRDGIVLGSSAYMSPEQALGMSVDARSDVFSFGIILYELLAGRRPFGGATLGEVRAAIARETPAPLALDVAPAIRAIVERCLAKPPGERFEDARAIAAALGQVTSPREAAAIRSAHRRGSVGWVAWIGVGFAVTVALIVTLSTRRTVGDATPLASAAPAPGQVVGASDAASGGASRSSSAEAQRVFDDALQSAHDGTGRAESLLARAVELDPGFGAAHLRLWLATKDPERVHFWRAAELEASLSAQDRELLNVLVAQTAGPEQARAVPQVLDRYLQRHPHDAMAWEARWTLGRSRAENCDAADRAVEIDPSFVAALAVKAGCKRFADDDAARELVERCLTMVPLAVDCLLVRMELEASSGACRDLEGDARRMLLLQPENRQGHDDFADALAANGAPIEAVREALGSTKGRLDGMASSPRAVLVPMFQGDFAEVERVAADLAKQAETSREIAEHAGPAIAAIAAYGESGDLAGAARLAEDFVARRAAWSEESAYDYDGMMAVVTARAGRLPRAAARSRAGAAYERLVGQGVDPYDAWGMEYAFAAATQEEGRASYARFEQSALSLDPSRWAEPSARTFFLARRGERARSQLERAVKSCHVLTGGPAVVTSHLMLGRLDEQAGNRASACAHYATVLERWGDAHPRSVAADEARAHSRGLSCAK